MALCSNFFALILGFSYFYASLTINPVDVASNLKKGGVAIPGSKTGSIQQITYQEFKID